MSAQHGPSIDRRMAAALVATLLAVAPVACKQAEAVEATHYQPSKITPAKNGGHPVVTLTKLGASQIGLQTAPVEAKKTPVPAAGTEVLVEAPTEPAKELKTIPYAAVLYDGVDGQPYVFVNTDGLSFHREDVTIDNVDEQLVDISSGPPVGTRVVTVGIAQIHGAELEYGAY
ncbi:MAG: hypothetical protein ACR2FE_12465 [Aeromicrobium sp.]